MFATLLIANRGEIAVRIARTARRMGIRTIAVYSDADRDALHVAAADTAFRIGPAPVAESYLDAAAILDAARRGGAEAIHPGYGFLSENPAFVEAVEAVGLTFVGPPAAAMRAMGLKDAAKTLMQQARVPIVPGYHGAGQDPALLAEEAARIGYPVLIKAAAGGGGKGMRRVNEAGGFAEALAGAQREASAAFGNDRVLVEKYLRCPRHVEIQVFADAHGHTVHLFERDCSLQRRHQKVIEEAPAPGMGPAMRAAMGAAAVRAAEAVGYRGAGTVEFITDASQGLCDDGFFFMEMNTRLQVEHPVTELITGLDLVEWQLRVAAGEPLPLSQSELAINGHAVEARLYAEDPGRGFLPQTGRLSALDIAAGPGLRVDAGVRAGDTVTPFYDPMIAKVVAHGATRDEALDRLARCLEASQVTGCTTNRGFLARLLRHRDVVAGTFDTGLIDRDLAALVHEPAAPVDVAAVAALAAAGLLDRPPGDDPFAALANFRLWGEATIAVGLVQAGSRREAGVTALSQGGFRVSGPEGDTVIDLIERTAEGVRVAVEGRVSRLMIDWAGETLLLRQDGVDYRFRRQAGVVDDGDAAPTADVVRAAMPGRVTAVHAAAGLAVRKGDGLVVTEAMKMELTLVAERDGRIASVEVVVGDSVQEGAVLVVLDRPDA